MNYVHRSHNGEMKLVKKKEIKIKINVKKQ